MSEARTITVPRTARYAISGDLSSETRDVWFVFHGYGQLAEDFVREFDHVARPDRVFIALEGLSRFYVNEGSGTVGASWMTKVAREDEITDYVNYLDAVHGEVMQRVAGDGAVRVCALGFSQGSATAYRWSVRGAACVDHLIAWAGDVPPDLDLARMRDGDSPRRLTLVVGSRDSFLSERRLAADIERLSDSGVPHELIRFEGGHRLDRDTLAALGAPSRQG